MTPILLHVPAFEHGILRLWSFDAASEAGRALTASLRAEPRDAGGAMLALGAERVDPYWLDLVALRDVAELGGLAGYLKQAYAVPDADLAGLAPAGDHVLIAPSRAFADHEQTLAPGPGLTPLGAVDIHEDVGGLRPMAPVATARRDPAAQAVPNSEPGPPAARGLRSGAILLLLLIAALFVFFVAR